jgi:aspartate aminotransferase
MSLTAERLDRIQPSLTIAISTVARKMIADGKNVISLSQGEPDFDTPRNVKDAAIRAIESGETKYTDVAGTQALRKAVAEKFKRDSGLDYKPEEIIISTGGKQVIFNAMLATRGGDPQPVLGQLSGHRDAGGRQAGACAMRAEQWVQAARRGSGSGDHTEDQVVHAE